MKYQDNLEKGVVNGFTVGIKQGSPLKDALDPDNDGHDHLRSVKRIGTVLQDGQGQNPTPAEE